MGPAAPSTDVLAAAADDGLEGVGCDVPVGCDGADVVGAADVEVLGGLLFVEEAVIATAHGLFSAENREGTPFAVTGYLRYKCSPVGVERAYDMVAHFGNYRAYFIFQRGDFVGESVLKVNCDRHGFADLESSLLFQQFLDSSLRALLLFAAEAFEDVDRGLGAPSDFRYFLRIAMSSSSR